MPIYLGGLALIYFFYFFNLCFASYATFLCHNVIACVFMGWLSAKVMVYNSPYNQAVILPVSIDLSTIKGEDFNSRFDSYKTQIEMWLESERPYLNPDFNLQEIIKRFGLNRTYASKIFNDGFGKSFILVVREYRINYAKKLIENNPSVSMSEISRLCGYSTPQAFHKAFAYCNDGLTPGKYAVSLGRKE